MSYYTGLPDYSQTVGSPVASWVTQAMDSRVEELRALAQKTVNQISTVTNTLFHSSVIAQAQAYASDVETLDTDGRYNVLAGVTSLEAWQNQANEIERGLQGLLGNAANFSVFSLAKQEASEFYHEDIAPILPESSDIKLYVIGAVAILLLLVILRAL